MNEEQALIKPARVLGAKAIVVSKWQVDEAVMIPVRKGYNSIAFWLPDWRQRIKNERTSVMRRFAMFAAILLGTCVSLSAKGTQNVSIAWDASSDPNTAGYVVYVGSDPANFTSQLNVGTNTTITLSGLQAGSTNYFAVSAYNKANVMSAPSQPITFIAPGKITMKSKSSPSSVAALSFPIAPGHSYQLQASTDMVNWSTLYQTAVATTNTMLNYTDVQAPQYSKRYYRLLMQ